MKNNSKGDITFKEGNIFVEVVQRTAENRVIMKNRLPESIYRYLNLIYVYFLCYIPLLFIHHNFNFINFVAYY